MREIDLFRNNHLIDPALHIWGWEVPVYLFLGGLTAGLMIITALLGRRAPAPTQSPWLRYLPFAAPVLLSAGMFALFLDLEYKAHVFRFYTAFRITSPMSWGAWILLLIYPATILLGLSRLSGGRAVGGRASGPTSDAGPASAEPRLMNLINRLREVTRFDAIVAWTKDHRRTRIIEWSNVILGVALGGYTGVLLGTLGARALWSSALLGPLFLVSGFSTGAALILLLPLRHHEHTIVRNWDLMAIAAEIVLIVLFIVGLITNGGAAGREAASLLLGGNFTAVFWTLVVGAGLIVPFFIESWEASRRVPATIIAPSLILIGGFMLRYILVAAGQ